MATVTERFALIESAAWTKIGVQPRNVLDALPPSIVKFQNKSDGQTYRLEFAAKLNAETVKPVLDLLRENMKDSYEQAGWGWNEKKKRQELLHEEARFLLVKDDQDDSLVGFTHFRFLVEGFCTVLYCYEVQIRQDRARRGLGKRLMTLLEIIARKFSMQWVMLTVLLNNVDASKFYRSIGYVIDETSPQMNFDTDGKDVPYEILSKKMG